MFFEITNALKKRLTLIFQDIFQAHPIFNKVEVFTKFPEQERPKHALMIRSVSGSSLKLSMDNFVRTARQYSSLANLKGIPGNSIEWVRDDEKQIDKISAPGFYIVKMITDSSFIINSFLLVDDELLKIEFIKGKKGANTKYSPINFETEIIFSENGEELKRNIHYTIDYSTGEILFNIDPEEFGDALYVDYQIIGEQSEEIKVETYTALTDAIPGVVLAFGDRLRKDDEQVVIVGKEPSDVAKVYGGRWQLSVDLVGLSQDDDQQERLIDYAISMFWAEWQDKLVNEGINVLDFSLSGESEDLEAEIPEEYFYTGGITFTAETDWEYFIPLVSEVRRISLTYGNEGLKETMTDVKESEYENKEFDERMVNSGHQLGLEILPSMPIIIQPAPPLKVKSAKYNQ